MADKSKKVRAIFVATVPNSSKLDETILDYICGILEDESTVQNKEEVEALLTTYLVDGQCAKDEEEAIPIIEKILEKMSEEGFPTCVSAKKQSNGTQPAQQGNGLKSLAAPIKLSTQINESYAEVEEKSTGWMRPEEKKSIVDRDKLEAVEAKREKRNAKKKKDEDIVVAKPKKVEKQNPNDPGIHAQPGAVQRPKDIKLNNFSLSYGKDSLLENCDLTLAYGRKYGLVGRNGTGKSTLLRHLSDREIDGIPSHIRILHVEQEVAGDDTTPLQSVLVCDIEREKLMAEEARLLVEMQTDHSTHLPERINKIHQRLQEIDADSAPARASAILSGLGFTASMQAQATKEFSGGWRMRIALGRALFSKPDLLLLDEPTNHLDLYSTLWLEDHLQKWPGTLFIVSHHRQFLSSVATDIIHLQNKKLDHYKGNYDMFEQTRDDRLKLQQRKFETSQRERKHIQQFIDRFRYKAARAALVQSRIKALERMEVIEEVSKDPTVILQFPDPDAIAPPILQFRDVTFGYDPEKPLFKALNIGIDLESRVALVGANGVGKSTLLNLMAGDREPSSGTVLRNPKLRFARFSQHFVDQLDLTLAPVEHFMKTYPGVQLQTVRTHLGSFGLSGDLALRTINTLSGGQKSRLVFAVISWRKPHVLLLDEPTNHLDIETIDALSQALLSYKGGVLLVSHDERLITLVCDQIWYLNNNTVVSFDGDFEEYKKFLLKDMEEKSSLKI